MVRLVLLVSTVTSVDEFTNYSDAQPDTLVEAHSTLLFDSLQEMNAIDRAGWLQQRTRKAPIARVAR